MSPFFDDQQFNENCKNLSLEEVKQKYPELDEVYVTTGFCNGRRDIVEKCWSLFQPYAETNFKTEAKTKGHFHQRVWELYLGAFFINWNYELCNKGPEGPDFKIHTQDNCTVWVEATAPGTEYTEWPEPGFVFGGDVETTHKKLVLNFTGAMKAKKDHYNKNREAGIINKNDSYIVAINGFDFPKEADHILEEKDGGNYVFKKALFALGPLVLKRTKTKGFESAGYLHSQSVQKDGKDGEVKIECGLFCNNFYKEISAVLFTYEHLHLMEDKNIEKSFGKNFVFTKNPYAINPLPDNFWPRVGHEFVHTNNNMIKYVNKNDRN